MGVPSWVYDDRISDAEKMRRFRNDQRLTIIAFALSIPLGIVIGIILNMTGIA